MPDSMRNRRVVAYVSPRLIVEFEMHRAGLAKIAVSEDMKAMVGSVVIGRAMPYAISISPRGKTLNYVSGWRLTYGHLVMGFPPMRRVVANLENISPHAAAVEWGRGGQQRILGRTLAHLNATSPIGMERAARKARAKAAFDSGKHPRGKAGRFVPSIDTIRRWAARYDQMKRESDAFEESARRQDENVQAHLERKRAPNRYRNRQNEPSTPSKPPSRP